jgi:predicted amidohydrolase
VLIEKKEYDTDANEGRKPDHSSGYCAGFAPFDLAGTLAKALALLDEAARSSAQLVCFGETFLPGYPAWLDYCPGAALWDHPPVKEVFADMRMNSVIVLSRAWSRIL